MDGHTTKDYEIELVGGLHDGAKIKVPKGLPHVMMPTPGPKGVVPQAYTKGRKNYYYWEGLR